jgi:uncharacterized protein YjiS (DUF1127 family)
MARILWKHIEVAADGARGRRMDAPAAHAWPSKPWLSRATAQALGIVSLWIERHRQRQRLAQLDPRLLRDIGITHRDAQRECDKPFWR